MKKIDSALRDYAVYSHAQIMTSRTKKSAGELLPPVDWWRENVRWLIAGGFAILLTIVGE